MADPRRKPWEREDEDREGLKQRTPKDREGAAPEEEEDAPPEGEGGKDAEGDGAPPGKEDAEGEGGVGIEDEGELGTGKEDDAPKPDDAFRTALEAFLPTIGEDGRFDVAKEVVVFERELGRTLTPDEHGAVRDRIMDAVLLESLNAEYEEVPPPETAGAGVEGEGNGTPGLSELVDAVMAEHSDWGAEQIKAEVLRRVKVTEDEGEPIA